jgi:hypothetical protein
MASSTSTPTSASDDPDRPSRPGAPRTSSAPAALVRPAPRSTVPEDHVRPVHPRDRWSPVRRPRRRRALPPWRIRLRQVGEHGSPHRDRRRHPSAGREPRGQPPLPPQPDLRPWKHAQHRALLAASVAYFALVERPCMSRDWPQRLWRALLPRAQRSSHYPELYPVADIALLAGDDGNTTSRCLPQ